MSGAPGFHVRLVRWTDDGDALRAVRRDVFIVEQGVAEELEWDDADAVSVHALASDGAGAPIGCGRLLPDGHIGRMAVKAPWRRRGVGAQLLTTLIEAARQRGQARTVLNAQVSAVPFYERYGYRVTGDVFEEAGIAHVVMERVRSA